MGDLGRMTPNEDECVAIPDPTTLIVCPWDTRWAWMAADLWFGGTEPFALCPRSILKRQLALAADEGMKFNLGVETELFVYQSVGPDGYLEPLARLCRDVKAITADVLTPLDMALYRLAVLTEDLIASYYVFPDAQAVRDWLQRKAPSNFPDSRFRIHAYGDSKPLASNETAEGRAKNRRVEIILSGKE